MKTLLFIVLACIALFSCADHKKNRPSGEQIYTKQPHNEISIEALNLDTIIDASYTFDEAVTGSGAPNEIIQQLELVDVFYWSTDHMIHKGQLVLCLTLR